MAQTHDWLTLHWVRFPEVVDGLGKPLPGPSAAELWRFAPQSIANSEGMVTFAHETWGGFGLYPSREAAEAVLAAPSDHLPFLDRTVEAWHALAVPYAHRGAVKWRDEIETDSAITVAPSDPKGPLVILTTAGFDRPPEPDTMARFVDFTQGVLDVLDHYGTLPGNRRRGAFSAGGVDGREGCTMSLWESDQHMMNAAYRSGVHKQQLARHQADPMFDRSSFTRARVVASRGTWDGIDPAAAS